MAGVLIDLNRGEVRRGAESINLSGRELELLVYLALEGQVVPPDDIIRVLWPNVAPERARATLRVNITRIRKRFSDPQIIVIVAGGYRLGVPVEVIGARTFANRIAP